MHKPLTLAASAVALALAALAPMAAAQAQAWPSQPLKALVPFGPGSSPDQVARIVTEKAALLGQSIVVENKPGASGNIGTYAIANAKPDGYTFGVSITGPLVNNTLLFDKLPYAPATDLAPLTLAVHQPNVLVVPAGSGIANVGQLLDALKKNPDKYNFPRPAPAPCPTWRWNCCCSRSARAPRMCPILVAGRADLADVGRHAIRRAAAHRGHAHGQGRQAESAGGDLFQALGAAARDSHAGRGWRAGNRGLGLDRLRHLVQGAGRHPEETVRRADPGDPRSGGRQAPAGPVHGSGGRHARAVPRLHGRRTATLEPHHQETRHQGQ